MSGGPSLEIRPFPTELPVSGSFLVTSDVTPPVMLTPTKAVNITTLIPYLCRWHVNGDWLWAVDLRIFSLSLCLEQFWEPIQLLILYKQSK